jgi:hypothetical protein
MDSWVLPLQRARAAAGKGVAMRVRWAAHADVVFRKVLLEGE